MTTDYSQISLPYSTGSAIDTTILDGPASLHWKTFKLPASDSDFKANGGDYNPDEVIGWQLKIDDLRGGYLQVGDFAKGGVGIAGTNIYEGDYRTVSTSQIDHRQRRKALLPSLLNNAFATVMPTATPSMNMCWTNVFNTLVVGQRGNSSNNTLWKETTTNTVQIVTYTKSIFALSPIIQGSATAAEQLCVMGSAAPDILSDLTTGGPTSAGSMHANLAPAFAMVQSPINATTPGTATNLFYANNGIWALPVTSAIGTAPTQVQSGVRNGGYGLGVETLLKNLPLRWFLAIPKVNSTAPNPVSGALPALALDIIHYDMEGADPQVIPFSLMNIYWACLWQRHVVATDGLQIKTFDGEVERDLNFLKGRPANSDVTISCQEIVVNGRDLISVTCVSDNTVATTSPGASYIQLEQYLPDFDAWVPVSVRFAPGLRGTSTGLRQYNVGRPLVAYCLPAAPISRQSGFCYIGTANASNAGTDISSIFLPPSEINPFERYRQTGSTAYNSQSFEAGPLTVTLPYFELPDMEGRWKRADQIVFMGDVDAGGTGAEVDISINGGTAIPFLAGVTSGPQVAQTSETGDEGLWMQLQITITLTRGSTTTKTPNGLPIVIRGRAYLTDPVGDGDGLPGGL